MNDLRQAAEMMAYEVPLHELLEGVPEDARLVIDSEDGMSTRFIPVGHLCKRAAEALRQALAQPEQEPVAWFIQYEDSHEFVWSKPDGWRVKQALEIQPLYDAPVDAVNMSQDRVDETAKGEQEPFIYIREDTERPFGGYEHCGEHEAGAFPVYTAPPKHEWVELTDEEIYDYADKFLYQHGSNYGIKSFGKAIEAKLKEKNS